MSNNPYNTGDRVAIQRGVGWLNGTVERTKLATVFVKLDDNNMIVQEHYRDCAKPVKEKETDDGNCEA